MHCKLANEEEVRGPQRLREDTTTLHQNVSWNGLVLQCFAHPTVFVLPIETLLATNVRLTVMLLRYMKLFCNSYVIDK